MTSTPLELREVDEVEVLVLADNFTDVTAPQSESVHRTERVSGNVRSSTHFAGEVPVALRAEHGFGALITTRIGREVHQLVFDTGSSPDGFSWNSEVLGVDLAEVEGVVLSHGHFDHTGGLDGVLRKAKRRPLPLYAHPHIWRKREQPGSRLSAYGSPTLDRASVESHSVTVHENTGPALLAASTALITGEIPRNSEFERGVPQQKAFVSDEWVEDEKTWDDQAIILNIRNKGLLVLTGCGHSGIVNTLEYAARLQPNVPVFAVAGGFHLNGADPHAVLRPVVSAFETYSPSLVLTCHCTGHDAFAALSKQLPGKVTAGAIGTKLSIARG